jgi:hypothetical protein
MITLVLGLLRRIIIRFAGIIAVPVILWTITAFIVGLPKVSTFHIHNPLATVSINASERATNAEPTQQQSTLWQAELADPQEAKATEGAAPEGSLLVQHLPDAPPSPPSAAQIADTPEALATISNSATRMVAKGDRGLLPPSAANDGAAAGATGGQPTAATEAGADVLSATAPLSGTIPLPRPRPHDASTVRTADTMLSRVPMPRPRHAAGGYGAQEETTTNNPSVPPRQR